MTVYLAMALILQNNDVQVGKRVLLDVNGIIYEAEVQEIHQNFLHLSALKKNGAIPRLFFNQPVYLMQELEEGGVLFVLLRFMQHSAREKRADIFRLVRSTFHVALGGPLRLPLCGWCELTIFSIFNRLRMEFNGRVQIYDLSETGIGLIVPNELPCDTFAECEFELVGKVLKLPSRATHGVSSDNGAYHRMEFEFISITRKERQNIRTFLFSEQARRLREG